jgi:hypothetical protein
MSTHDGAYRFHRHAIALSTAAASGLVCPKGFPAAFGSFPALETLMLRFNDFNGDTLSHVSEVRTRVKAALEHGVPPWCRCALRHASAGPGNVHV